MKYGHIFHEQETNDFKETTVEHEIPVGDARPIRRPLTECHIHFEGRWNRCRKCSRKVSSEKVIHLDRRKQF
jgi:hypothetical protein